LDDTILKLVNLFLKETDVKKKRLTEQQIIGFLKEAEAGLPVKDLCRGHGFSDAAFYGWRTKCGGLQVSEAKRLRELEAENAKLKKLLAEAHRDRLRFRPVVLQPFGEPRGSLDLI
jgi:putative transposase